MSETERSRDKFNISESLVDIWRDEDGLGAAASQGRDGSGRLVHLGAVVDAVARLGGSSVGLKIHPKISKKSN